MSDFTFLTKYVLPSTDESTRNEYSSFKHMLFRSNVESIQNSDSDLKIPMELKQFYTDIGYGFFHQNEEYSNDSLLSPESFMLINNREDYYEYDPELELYNEPEYRDKLIFFEVNEGVYLLMDKDSNDGKNAIYFFDTKIADSLEAFLIRFDEQGHYFEEEQ